MTEQRRKQFEAITELSVFDCIRYALRDTAICSVILLIVSGFYSEIHTVSDAVKVYVTSFAIVGCILIIARLGQRLYAKFMISS